MKIIFHHPAPLGGLHSGSVVRPQMMRQAMIHLGHELFEITGERKERKKKFAQLKKQIQNGDKFDLYYSESTTQPLNLRIFEVIKGFKIYLPEALDQSILKFLNKKKIKGGFFLRDIYWEFENESNDITNSFKKFYIQYFQSVFGKLHFGFLKSNSIHLYVPSFPFGDFVQRKTNCYFNVLIPGTNNFESKTRVPFQDLINLIYVGGVAGVYNPELFLEAISKSSYANLVLCTRKSEWQLKSFPFNPDRIQVIHLSGMELKPYFSTAHIGIHTQPPIGYGKMTFSVKIAEYIGQGLPVLCYKNTTIADLVEEYQIGWTVEYDVTSIQEMISYIVENPDDYILKQNNVLKLQNDFTWESVVKRMIGYALNAKAE